MKDMVSQMFPAQSERLELIPMVDENGHRFLTRKRPGVKKKMQHQEFLTRSLNRRISDPDAPRWDELKEAAPGLRRHFLGKARLVDYHRDAGASKAFDLLRTRLMSTLKQNGWSRIAIAGPTAGCGATFTAVNLALSLSRVPQTRTVLMDLNLRDPNVADTFDVDAGGQIGDFLTGQRSMADHLVRLNDTLALGLSREADVNAAESLHDPRTAHTLSRMRTALDPDVVLYDLPPMLAHDDVSAFLSKVDGVLLIADGTKTLARHLAECEKMLEGNTPLLGVILNRARASSIPQYQ